MERQTSRMSTTHMYMQLKYSNSVSFSLLRLLLLVLLPTGFTVVVVVAGAAVKVLLKKKQTKKTGSQAAQSTSHTNHMKWETSVFCGMWNVEVCVYG